MANRLIVGVACDTETLTGVDRALLNTPHEREYLSMSVLNKNKSVGLSGLSFKKVER